MIRPVILPLRRIEFCCRRCHDQSGSMCVFFGVKDFNTVYLVTAAYLTQTFQQYSADSRGAFSVGGHAPARIQNTIQCYWKWWGQMSRSVCRKISHMQFALRLILRYLADDLNCLYFFGNAGGLEPLMVQNIILIECRGMIDQNLTEIR